MMVPYSATTRETRETHHRLPDLPDDCLAEAFSELSPLDLLAVRLSCRILAFLLLSRGRSRHIWRRAIGNVVGLPPCPRDMTELAYARLCFDPVCFSCAERCTSVEWDLRVRLCPSCASQLVASFAGSYPPVFLPNSSIKIEDIVHCRAPSYGNGFLRSDLAAIRLQYEGLGSEQRAQFQAARKATMIEDRVHARSMRAWHIRYEKAKAKADAAIVAKRFTAVSQRLLALGWSDELRAVGKTFRKLRLVRMVEPLTDDSWPTIQPFLERFLSDFRAQEVTRRQKQFAALAALAALPPVKRRCKAGQLR